jgi:hypothetical protein
MSIAPRVRQPSSPPLIDSPRHSRHRPERSLLTRATPSWQIAASYEPQEPVGIGIIARHGGEDGNGVPFGIKHWALSNRH